jgi:hypothetical protein
LYLKDLVDDYYRNGFSYEENIINSYKNFVSVEGLIAKACYGQLGEYRKDPHKNRIYKEAMEDVAKKMILSRKRLDRVRNFKDCLKWVYECKVSGFNSLSVYDTACAIALHKDIYPEEIYLHTGALEGAINLFGKSNLNKLVKYYNNDVDYPYFELEFFPEILRDLGPFHIENFLCHYKNELALIENVN